MPRDFGWRCGISLSCDPGALAHSFSRASLNSPTKSGYTVVQNLAYYACHIIEVQGLI
jgi:hypothetical protein